MTAIQGPISIVNDQYDPDPAAGAFANQQYHRAADGMLFDGSSWRKIIGLMLWDGSSWRLPNTGNVGGAGVTGVSDASTCDPRGNAPTYPPLYKVNALLSGDAGSKYWIYWFRNGVHQSFNGQGVTPGGAFTIPFPGSGANAIQDNDTIGFSISGAGSWPGSVAAQSPPPPQLYSVTVYLACGRPV